MREPYIPIFIGLPWDPPIWWPSDTTLHLDIARRTLQYSIEITVGMDKYVPWYAIGGLS